MQIYHTTDSDPVPLGSLDHDQARAELKALMDDFEARGGRVQTFGFKMLGASGAFTGASVYGKRPKTKKAGSTHH
ncbi:MAG TPA: hypothetical protein VNV36_06080 [Pseudomonas sp.]|uniref:hypothetical protein n=1 Tax=Pseudomonas sp. TaxID=306 RepID=UPI002B8BBFCF|nr:hypothetical protein [Pseudomonas sp.]HWH86326.1 hypothetical protein [Pseudomonas sp.]